MSGHDLSKPTCDPRGVGVRVRPCGYGPDGFCCMGDHDDPCFAPVLGPERRPVRVRYSGRFTEQVRSLSGDHRWPLRLTSPESSAR